VGDRKTALSQKNKERGEGRSNLFITRKIHQKHLLTDESASTPAIDRVNDPLLRRGVPGAFWGGVSGSQEDLTPWEGKGEWKPDRQTARLNVKLTWSSGLGEIEDQMSSQGGGGKNERRGGGRYSTRRGGGSGRKLSRTKKTKLRSQI